MRPGGKMLNEGCKRSEESSEIWNYAPPTFDTTFRTSFTDKTSGFKNRQKPALKGVDHIWALGFEDTHLLYRRKKLLAPLSVIPQKEVDGQPLSSTHQRDYVLESYQRPINSLKQQGRIAGVKTYHDKYGVTYSSEHLSNVYKAHHKPIRREHSIFLKRQEQYKRFNVQHFTDDILPPLEGMVAHDQQLTSQKVVAGLTIPLTGI
ncbi:hypothetical protein BC833DRAFT_623841 [Globomyces pollinis-pini]|nr:hypothetical protein BC833DRAFT_623841 [Globomyces pollinis-pini]